MRWNDGFIAVDWGTTNRRAYLVGPTGQVINQVQDEYGILNVPSGIFAAAAMQLRDRLGAFPLLLAGMIGSNLGWKPAPYVRCPAGLMDLKQAICWVEPNIAIVPGVSFQDTENADIMRGEELQVLGAASTGIVPPDCVVCQPGTHTKWVQVVGGRITGFKTAMTGEVFGLLRKHSILSGGLQQPVQDGPHFAAGVSRSFEHTDLLTELFRVRARAILDPAPGDTSGASSFVSGLLVGSDVREAAADCGNGPIIVAGEPHLTALYAKALGMAGHKSVEIDGAQAFLAGAKALVENF